MQNLNTYIEQTNLKPDLLISEVKKLYNQALYYQFYAVCVPPNFIKFVSEYLKETNIKIVTVIGFPFGYSAIEAKVAETILAIVDGADELDVVANISAIKNGDWKYISDEIKTILPIIRNKQKKIKVIIETGVLTDNDIKRCCEMYGLFNVDFLKTSTGYAAVGATTHAVKLLKKYLPPNIQIKASGGIKDLSFAQELIAAGATRIGTSNGVLLMEENKSRILK